MITVENLDKCYDDCNELYYLEKNKGIKVLTDLEDSIGSLETHWKGNDATENINVLIKIHEELQTFLNKIFSTTIESVSRLTDLQRVRSSNGGEGQIGDTITENNALEVQIPYLEETTEYLCEPDIIVDYRTLCDIESEYESFSNEFLAKKDVILQNWTVGYGIEDIKKKLDEYESIFTESKASFKKTLGDINTVVSNMHTVI